MKKLILLLLLFTTIAKVRGQEAQNIADLDFLYQAIQKVPSYKDQLKSDKTYVQLYQQLRKELNTTDELIVFQKLAQLIFPLRDNHLALARKPDSNFKFISLKPEVDLVRLEKKLIEVPLDSIEGVFYEGQQKYLIYKQAPQVYYVQSIADNEVKAILCKNQFSSYDVVQFKFGSYPYVLNRNIKFLNGLLIGLNYAKEPGKTYYDVVERKEKYSYKMLNETTGYLSLGTFSSSNQNIEVATRFFDQISPTITTKNLIVDVRNNGGGGYKTSKQFLAFLDKFKGEVYVLQNAYTVSNAEQFILKLREKRKITTMGESTMGTITYGSNYGKRITLPSDRFTFYPTDMSGLKKELVYESIGIKPDVYLNPFTEDWVAQALKQIK
ncbi:MAG: S41 family peptidase [Bacteroidota bacterium]